MSARYDSSNSNNYVVLVSNSYQLKKVLKKKLCSKFSFSSVVTNVFVDVI
jgi:hypothetical protein